MNDYIDPVEYQLVISNSSKVRLPSENAKLVSEMTVKIRVSEDIAIELLESVIDKANQYIKNTSNVRKMFPSWIDVLFYALSLGFSLHAIKPELHFVKTERTGDELHICSLSIRAVIE